MCHTTARDHDQHLDEELKKLFPLQEDDPNYQNEKHLLIFDGTSNQKLPILMWMSDQVQRSINIERAKTNDEAKHYQLNLIEIHFRSVLGRIRTTVFEITNSASPYSEDFRKLFIEKCAHIIATFGHQVDELAEKSRENTAPPQSIDQSLVQRFVTESLAQQRTTADTPPQQPAVFQIPRAAVPMTRIRGVPDGIYVSPKPKGINIHEYAYADHNRLTRKIPYRIDVNETYEEVLQGIPKNLTYVGARYPDGSSLSYLPIKHVTLLREQSEVQFPTEDEGGVVELLLSKGIFDGIKKLCALAYLDKFPDHTIRYPHEDVVDRQTVKIQALARGYRRMRIINGKRVFHVSLLHALQECTHDMTGDGLLHLRFDRPNSEDKRATMKLIFFGLQMVRNASNHFQKIFRL